LLQCFVVYVGLYSYVIAVALQSVALHFLF
jgi:hypothetical protein